MPMMTRREILLGAVCAVLLPALPAAAAPDPQAAFDALLARYVKVGGDGLNRVDYARWHASRADRQALDATIAALAAQAPSAMARAEAFAYWANLYNAITLKVIIDRYPVKSIRDIRSEGVWLDPKAYAGPWRTKRVSVEGRSLSLDDIEHEIMRPTFKDPRVHYAVNCASVGCPNLMPKAWRSATLEADLDAAARAFVNHPRGARVKAGKLTVSSIYAWFKEDFGGTDAAVIAHLKQFAKPDLRQKLASIRAIDGDDYDWTLNGPSAPATGS
jgi:hypothetical protein